MKFLISKYVQNASSKRWHVERVILGKFVEFLKENVILANILLEKFVKLRRKERTKSGGFPRN